MSGHTGETRADDSLENSHLERKEKKKGKKSETDSTADLTHHLSRAVRHRRVFFSGGSHGGAHGRYQSRSTVLRRIFGEGKKKKTTGVADDEVDKSLSFSQDSPPPFSLYTQRRPTLAAQSPFPEQQTSRLVRHMHPERRKGSMRSIREGGGEKKEGKKKGWVMYKVLHARGGLRLRLPLLV